jgi:RNA-directed DNA polymerase
VATILNRIPVHPNAHGFVRGRSAITFAREHANADVVVRLDLRNFFVSIDAGRVYGVFRTAGYPESVAHTLTGLTTGIVPRVVWQEAPPPQTPTSEAVHEHFMLGRRLALPHLPQGAPTSPALANLCAHSLDRRLAGLAEGMGLRYSRYADDLAMSGSLRRPAVTRLVELIREIAVEEGFKVNEAKTLVMAKGHRQRLAGVVVNKGPNLERPAYDRLRAILHNAANNGLEAENRSGHTRFAEHLAGRVSWAVSLNQDRKTTLERLLAEATTKRLADPN